MLLTLHFSQYVNGPCRETRPFSFFVIFAVKVKIMKNKLIIILSAVTAILLVAIGIQTSAYKRSQEDVRVYRGNVDALMRDVEAYRTKDSMSVAKTAALELRLSEFEDFCEEQKTLIKKLNIQKKELESIVTSQTEAIYELSGHATDSVIKYVDRVQTDTVTKIAYSDKWIDLDLLIKEDKAFEGRIATRDNLHVVENVEYKRFLGFLWRTSKVKKREVNVVSESPYSTITNVEYVEIRK